VTAQILAAASPGEVQVAVVSAGELLDYAIWRPGAPDGVGDLCLGRVGARVPAMAGAFVFLPGTEGFLPDTESGGEATEGAFIGVRISRAASGGKGPRLTARLDVVEQAEVAACAPGPPRLLRRGPSPLEWLAAWHPAAPVLVDDPALSAALRPVLGERLALVRAAFGAGVADQLAELAAPTVTLPNGARLHFHPTPALTAVDVDAGAATSDTREKKAAQDALNRSVLPQVARHIRLRNLSGAILIDFAGLSRSRRPSLGPALAAELAKDPLGPRLLGFTALGFAEVVRPRVHPPLHELLTGPHAAGLAALRQAEAELQEHPGRPPTLRAAPDVTTALQSDPVALADFTRRNGHPLSIRSDPTLAPSAWRLNPA
jgi:Ribonuclease G/E